MKPESANTNRRFCGEAALTFLPMICWRDDWRRGNDGRMISRRLSRPAQGHRVVAVLVAFLTLMVATLGRAEAARDGQSQATVVMEPIHWVDGSNGTQRLVPRGYLRFEGARPNGVAFHAVCTNEWPAGLVPIFEVERTNRIELRRRPELGMEVSSEPIFFALPPEDEPEAARIAGRWDCKAIRGNGSKDFLVWELAIEGEKIAGRFDPNTEYRVATIAGGNFRSNRFELHVEYFRDFYVLNGVLRDGRLSGEWRHTEDSERGTWEATRQIPRLLNARGFVEIPLYEWRRAADDVRRYAVEGEKLPPEWQRAARPLCRVWRQSP